MQKEPVYTVLLTSPQILELLEAARSAPGFTSDLQDAREILARAVRQPQSSTNQESHHGNAQSNS